MKVLTYFENILNPYVLIALNLALILGAEFIGEGMFFHETGLVHAVAFIFVGMILLRIFSDYAFSDYILKGFLKIQFGFFLLIGILHIYEYFGLHVWMLDHEALELSATVSYLVWIFGLLLALQFVFRIYQKKTTTQLWVLSTLVALGLLSILGMNFSHEVAEMVEESVPVILIAAVLFGVAGIRSLLKIREIMPVFGEYSNYAIPATVLIIIVTFSEFFESTHVLEQFGVSETQLLYIAHFLLYGAISLLLIGFGKLKKPTGIYENM